MKAPKYLPEQPYPRREGRTSSSHKDSITTAYSTDYLGIKIVGHQARGQRPGCRTHTVPGRPGCGPGSGLTWPASLDPGTIFTVGIWYADATGYSSRSRFFAQARVMSQYAGITPVSDCGFVYAHRVPIVEVAVLFDNFF